MLKRANIANKEIEQKEQENLRVRRELKECQEQLTLLHSFVKQLQVDFDKSNRSLGKVEKESITENVTDSDGGGDDDDDDDDSDCSFSFSCDDESCDIEWSSQQEASDGEETISTFHAGVGDCRRNSVRKRSVHSRRNLRLGSVHSSKSSIRSASRQSIIRSTRGGGGGDDGDSIVSKLSMGYHSAAPSIKWRLPLEIELMGGNEENHHQDKDDYSAAPSIKWRLPLEIELLDGNEENHHQDKDDNSLFGESYRKPDDDSRSVGLFSVTTSRTNQSSRRNVTFSPSTKKDIPKEIDLHGGEDGNNGGIEGNDEYSYAACRWSAPNWVEMSPVKSPRRTIYKGLEGFVTNSS